MFNWHSVPILLCHQPIDMRKSIDGLSILVRTQFNEMPTNGSLYVFYNRLHDKLKILYWDRNGFCLWYKRLEQDRFCLKHCESGLIEITGQQLRWLLDGLDYSKLKGHPSTCYSVYC